MHEGPHTSLDLTHVLYDDSSYLSFALALVTLSPILLMASYAALAVQLREYTILVMWTGQFFGELLNSIIKDAIKQERPRQHLGSGYGFPSSHSQYMAYFTAFLTLWRLVVYTALFGWTGAVAYSRYYLGYHTPLQIVWGLVIGAVLGISLYILAILIPQRAPDSVLGQIKTFILDNPVSVWFQLRDGWSIWEDGGRDGEWRRWRAEWEKRQQSRISKSD
ncbi:hypothetical protein CVT24_000690 [Panaeolus cyanescens]|uniref:Phosphatidic acid phosphatase type 2/haloperoxidase domain-containing protein n=1 Tax=Panaeolus cyanescens TaxID=181874 RepID=A0A409W750_9AGAR|nr:hypothetical protein CVT24_000690 [Panaeolus cyanescens]